MTAPLVADAASLLLSTESATHRMLCSDVMVLENVLRVAPVFVFHTCKGSNVTLTQLIIPLTCTDRSMADTARTLSSKNTQGHTPRPRPSQELNSRPSSANHTYRGVTEKLSHHMTEQTTMHIISEPHAVSIMYTK